MSPDSSPHRTIYPVALWSGFQLSRIEFWVISATCKVVEGKVVGAPAIPR